MGTVAAKAEYREGLVPETGDWNNPGRWVDPDGQEDTLVAPPAEMAVGGDLLAQADANLPGLDWKTLVTEAYSTSIEGYEATITSVSSTPGNLSIKMELTEGMNDVGYMEREFRRNEHTGTYSAIHEMFELQPEYQTLGLGTDITERTEAAYLKHGITSISLLANSDIGGYAWARQGYDFAHSLDPEGYGELDRDSVDRSASFQINKKASGPAAEALEEEYFSLEHAWEIAAWNPFDAPWGAHLGKDIMLDSNWYGTKVLDPKEPGFKVGQEYRAAKRQR